MKPVLAALVDRLPDQDVAAGFVAEPGGVPHAPQTLREPSGLPLDGVGQINSVPSRMTAAAGGLRAR